MPTIHLTLPSVQPTPGDRPRHCPHCGHWRLHRHGRCAKPIRDRELSTVSVDRYRCTACRRTFRHYPAGVTRADHSQRLVAIGALLWAAGLRLRWCERVLQVFGLVSSDTSIWRAVGRVGTALASRPLGRAQVLGVDGVALRLAGQTVGVVVAVDDASGDLLALQLLDERDPQAVMAWLAPLVAATGATVLVTDDLSSYGVVASELGLERQGCVFHLKRWVRRALDELEQELAERGDERWQDLILDVRRVVTQLAPDGGARLHELWTAMREVRYPAEGEWPPEVRLRHLLGRVSDHWHDYQRWRDDPTIPTTNNRTEQAIGRLKVRSRTVRGYKRESGMLAGILLAAAIRSGGNIDLAAPLLAA